MSQQAEIKNQKKRTQQSDKSQNDGKYNLQTYKNLKKIKEKHPDCVLVHFMKHPQAAKHVKPPKNAFILFKKEFNILQCMIVIQNQIQQKGLLFSCVSLSGVNDTLKYHELKPGPTIQQTYNQYGKGGYLTILYADKYLGMKGILKTQKWLFKLLFFIIFAWVFVNRSASYFTSNEQEKQMHQQVPETLVFNDQT